MKLRANDRVSKLYFLAGAGLLTASDIQKMVDNAKDVQLFNHLQMTLEQFATFSELKTDLEIVSYAIELKNGKKAKNVAGMRVGEYLETLKFVKKSIEDISRALEGINQPEMSPEMRAAGFGRLNFGDLGIARTVGEFENIGTIQAYSLQMHVVIKSLEQLAAVKRCEKAHQDLLKEKSERKKFR